jgi:hypothetical protein
MVLCKEAGLVIHFWFLPWDNKHIRYQNICLLSFKIFLLENLPAFICFPADPSCRLFSLGGHLNADSESYVFFFY